MQVTANKLGLDLGHLYFYGQPTSSSSVIALTALHQPAHGEVVQSGKQVLGGSAPMHEDFPFLLQISTLTALNNSSGIGSGKLVLPKNSAYPFMLGAHADGVELAIWWSADKSL